MSITEAELDGAPCPECQEVRGQRSYDFEDLPPTTQSSARYRCEHCGLLVES